MRKQNGKKLRSKDLKPTGLEGLEKLFDKKLKPIDTKLNKLTGDVSKLTSDVSGLKTGQTKLSGDVSKLTSDVSSIQSTMVTKNDLEKTASEIKTYVHEGVETIMEGMDKVADKLAERERVGKLETAVRKIAAKVGIAVDVI